MCNPILPQVTAAGDKRDATHIATDRHPPSDNRLPASESCSVAGTETSATQLLLAADPTRLERRMLLRRLHISCVRWVGPVVPSRSQTIAVRPALTGGNRTRLALQIQRHGAIPHLLA